MAYTIDRRSEGKNSISKQAKYARSWRKKHEANGMCIKCGREPVGGAKKTCPSCVDRATISQRKSHFRNHLVEFGVPKNCLGNYADVLADIKEALACKGARRYLEKVGVYRFEDYIEVVDQIENALNAAAL